MKKTFCGWLVTLLIPVGAAAEIGYRGWGPRLGVADDPDQFVIGFHQDLGEIVENLRLQPSLDLGIGDDHTVLSAVVPVHYRFDVDSNVTPYVGGGVQVAWIDRETPRRDDTELEIGPVAVGGIEWRLSAATDVLVELQLGSHDVQDAKLLVGLTWGSR